MKYLSLFLLLFVPAHAQPPLPKGVTRVASVEGITEYRLDNGLRALLFPDPSKPTITVNITYLIGSRHENYGEAGMAHIIEHLVSYGSPRHPDAKKEQADRGATRNASTSWDRTNYFEIVPANDDNLQWALDLESDRMMNAPVRKDILASQMSVVRNEYEAGQNSPQSLLFQRVIAMAYDWHNYGKMTIGTKSDIENVPIERLQEFYARYYRPDNAVLVVAGRLDEAKTLDLLAKLFGPLRTPATPIPQTYTVEPAQDGERSLVLRRTGDVQQVAVIYKIPAAAHPDSSLLSAAAHALANAPSGRMYKALVETGKAASVGGGPLMLREPGFMTFNASVRKDRSVEEARSLMTGILDGLAAQPFTKVEIDRARADLLKNIELSLTQSDQVGLSLTSWAAAGDWRLLFIHRDRIRKATPEDVQRAALAYLKPSNRTVGLFIPEDNSLRADIPAAPDIAALVKDYKGDQAVAQGEAFDPSPDNIEKRTVRETIPNGMKLAMLPKKTRGATVHAVIRLNFGDQSTLKGRASEASFAAQMLMRGTAKRSRQQIQDELSRLKAQVNVAGGPSSVTVNVQTVAASLPEVLRLATEVLRDPAFAQTEFEQLRNSTLAGYENTRKQPEALAQITLMRHMNPYAEDDVRYIRTPDEQIAAARKLTLEDVKKFYRDFYGASNAEMTVVGDCDPTEVRKLAGELLGSWKSPAQYARITRDYQKIAAANQSLETPDKANAMFAAGTPLNMSEMDPDYPAMMLANYMLGGHSSARLYVRIRGKEGLSYGVGTFLQSDVKDARSLWMMMAITNPANIGKVEAAFRDEVGTALKGGFAADEIATAKKGWQQSRNVQRSQDTALASRLLQQAHDGVTMAYETSLEQKVSALTPDQINAAIRKHLDLAQVSIVRAGDFQKAAAGAAGK
jgi:zinc protease